MQDMRLIAALPPVTAWLCASKESDRTVHFSLYKHLRKVSYTGNVQPD